MDKDSKMERVAIVILSSLIIGFTLYIFKNVNEIDAVFEIECKNKGGIPYINSFKRLCFNPTAIIEVP